MIGHFIQEAECNKSMLIITLVSTVPYTALVVVVVSYWIVRM